ncbi:MAG: hypothetical protein HY952_05635 [Elusimicrobia bacterium]|nr:hypothetical protein [Elusimicrobiota bacterium]
MRTCVLMLLVSLCAGLVSAGDGGTDPFALSTGKEHGKSIRDFDIDAVVEAVTSAMADAARNYYLPDKTADRKAVSRYRKDARTLLSRDSTFRRSLGEVCVGLANTAVKAVNQEWERLPGKPLTLPVKQSYAPYDEGVSSITVTEGEPMVVYTNTMPCINAAGKELNGGVRMQYLPDAPEGSSELEYYGRGAAAIMSSDQLFSHALAEVCAKLVHLAKKEAGSGGAPGRLGEGGCSSDKDCRLIYSNCDCAAVPTRDPRAVLEGNGAVCKWNLCLGHKLSAVCRQSRCVKSGE